MSIGEENLLVSATSGLSVLCSPTFLGVMRLGRALGWLSKSRVDSTARGMTNRELLLSKPSP